MMYSRRLVINSTARTLIVTSSALPARCAMITAAANAGVTSKLLSCALWARLANPSRVSRKARGSWFCRGPNLPPLNLATPVHRYGRKIAINTHQKATVITHSFFSFVRRLEFHHEHADQHQPTGYEPWAAERFFQVAHEQHHQNHTDVPLRRRFGNRPQLHGPEHQGVAQQHA